jgi:putative transposase
LKCFRPFVASWPAPSASGRSESGRVGISPTGLVHLSQGTHNVFIERLWRSVKYEEIYLHAYRDGREARQQLTAYFDTYNRSRLHQSLDYRTPDEMYFAGRADHLAAAA